MEQMYAQFNAWKEKFQDSIIDMATTDGPFVEAKEVVGGYMIVSAESMDEALEVARQSPGVAMPGCSVEVREISTP
jgi:hypothetical protein